MRRRVRTHRVATGGCPAEIRLPERRRPRRPPGRAGPPGPAGSPRPLRAAVRWTSGHTTHLQRIRIILVRLAPGPAARDSSSRAPSRGPTVPPSPPLPPRRTLLPHRQPRLDRVLRRKGLRPERLELLALGWVDGRAANRPRGSGEARPSPAARPRPAWPPARAPAPAGVVRHLVEQPPGERLVAAPTSAAVRNIQPGALEPDQPRPPAIPRPARRPRPSRAGGMQSSGVRRPDAEVAGAGQLAARAEGRAVHQRHAGGRMAPRASPSTSWMRASGERAGRPASSPSCARS